MKAKQEGAVREREKELARKQLDKEKQINEQLEEKARQKKKQQDKVSVISCLCEAIRLWGTAEGSIMYRNIACVGLQPRLREVTLN